MICSQFLHACIDYLVLYEPEYEHEHSHAQSVGAIQAAHDEYMVAIQLVRNGTDYHTKSIKSLPDAYYNLGLLYLHSGRTEAALDIFEEALGLDPNHVEVLNSKGYVYT